MADSDRRDLTQPSHLPKQRPDGRPPHPSWLPRQRRGTTPQMIGRYPDYDVFDAANTWDAATAKVIEQRMAVADREYEFFTAREVPTLETFCDVSVAQDEDPKIPVGRMIDQKLAAGQLDGYQYSDMPDDRDTWRLVIAGLDEIAERRYGQPTFAVCDAESQEGIVEQFADGGLEGGSWERLNVKRAWSVCMRMVLAAFYSHPWAWNEIGFGGPAYPRGFMRLGPVSTREPFERAGATAEDPVRVAPELGNRG